MRTVIVGDPPELEAWIARRRASGQDRFDEVWDGEYHMAAGPNFFHSVVAGELAAVLSRLGKPRGLVLGTDFNLGPGEHNFRVPDLGLHRTASRDEVWLPTAAMVVEVVSPGDESWLKFDHYATHGVDEVLIADPRSCELFLFVLAGGRYEPADRSPLLDVALDELHASISWPGETAKSP